MNKVFAAKFLQNLNNKKGEKGFTLIELLVVVIIIGVLAAVALPNLLKQVGKSRETEIKNIAGTVVRTQQSYHFEKQTFRPTAQNTKLDTTIKDTLLGVSFDSKYVDFIDLATNATDTTVTTTNDGSVTTDGKNSEDDGTRAFSGRVDYAGGDYTQIVCQTDDVADAGVAPSAAGACDAGTTLLK
jgi:prepilin-type N-terminal cleavage/methylation domain-containing protein